MTEVGRQPWVIHGIMRTSEAVTPMPGLAVPLVTFTGLYFFLGVIVVVMLRRHVLAAPKLDSEVRGRAARVWSGSSSASSESW